MAFTSYTSFYLVVGVVFTVLAACRAVYQLVFHPLAKFPGPKLAALSNIWYARAIASKKPHMHMLELHRKYGHVVRVAPNELSFDTVTSLTDVYAHHVARKFPKGALFDGFINGGEPSLVAVRDPVAHSKKRKFLAHAFSAAALRSHEPLIQHYADLFIHQVAAHGEHATGVNVSQYYTWYAADVVGHLAFGESFGCLESASTHPWVAVVHDHTSSIIWLDVLRRFPLLRKVVSRLMMRPEVMEARRKNYEFSKQKVLKRMEMKTEQKDFMSYLLDQPDDDGMLSDTFLTLSASTFTVAGSETTSTALTGITYCLLRSPEAMQKAAAELQARFKSYEEIQPLKVQDLPYLNACVEEGLRLVPPAPGGATRVCPGATISGYYVPAGVEVSSNPIAMNRHPDHFHDPDKFLPERWLEKRDRLEASQPFSIGPRACIGRNLAYLEIRLLLAKLIYSFEMRLVNDNLDWDRDAEVDTFWSMPPVMVQFKER